MSAAAKEAMLLALVKQRKKSPITNPPEADTHAGKTQRLPSVNEMSEPRQQTQQGDVPAERAAREKARSYCAFSTGGCGCRGSDASGGDVASLSCATAAP